MDPSQKPDDGIEIIERGGVAEFTVTSDGKSSGWIVNTSLLQKLADKIAEHLPREGDDVGNIIVRPIPADQAPSFKAGAEIQLRKASERSIVFTLDASEVEKFALKLLAAIGKESPQPWPMPSSTARPMSAGSS